MNLGTNDKKKVGFLVALSLVAGYAVYSNLLSGPSYQASPQPAATRPTTALDSEPDASRVGAPAPVAGAPSQAIAPDIRRANPNAKPKGEEFHPALRSKRVEERIDPFTVDPTLHLELLAKVQEVKPDGGQRNLFQFGAIQPAEAPKGPEPVVKPKLAGTHLMGPMEFVAPPKPEVAKAEPPPLRPIPYKYYGLSTTRINGKKTAFFLDGEEIILAPEGYIVKKQFKVVRIGATSVLMEDVESKRQQTLSYTEDAGQNASE